MLEILNIVKSFAGAPAVRDASLTVEAGELVCLLGPSGCGKSTLLRVISGLTVPDSGAIRIAGVDITRDAANKRPTAMVFQSHALWSHMNVARNVGFGLRVRGLARGEIDAKVTAALGLVGLAGFARRLPQELSGGQAQRVALARCLVVEPKVLLMDEPFSALDAHLRKSLREELKALQRRLGLTTIFVTHDQEEAMELADRIVVMRDGAIEQIDTPGRIYAEPKTLSVAQFIGSMNACLASATGGRVPFYGTEIDMPVDGNLALLCRPEELEPRAHGFAVQVTRSTDLGPMIRLGLLTPGGESLTWTCPRDQAPAVGTVLHLWPKRLHVFRDGALLATLEAPAQWSKQGVTA
jgi:putative spermidine/putrescine transport system ATP-binding protein